MSVSSSRREEGGRTDIFIQIDAVASTVEVERGDRIRAPTTKKRKGADSQAQSARGGEHDAWHPYAHTAMHWHRTHARMHPRAPMYTRSYTHTDNRLHVRTCLIQVLEADRQ